MAFRKYTERKRKKKKQKSEEGTTGSCPICIGLSSDQLDELINADNKLSYLRSIGLSVKEEELLKHFRVCVPNQSQSRYARANRQYDMLWDAIDVAHREYMKSPTMYTAVAYRSLVKQLNDLLITLENIQNADELTDELVKVALNPLIKGMTNTIISEIGTLKEEILERVGEDESERVLSDFVKRLTVHFKALAERSRDGIEQALSAKDKKRSTKGKPNHLKVVS